MDDIGSILVLVALIIMSGFFSATETAFTSLNRIKLKTLAETNSRARLALKLASNYDKLLSTVLIGNNIVNIASASMATVLFVKWVGGSGVALSTVVMTVLVLVFGEISPKSLAKESPESSAIFAAPIIKFLMVLLSPVNALFSLWKKLLNKLFTTKKDTTITDGEILTMVEESLQTGGIDENEGEMIRNAIEFNDRAVSGILTPRVDIEAVDKSSTIEEIAVMFAETEFSRLPVYEGGIDNIIGVLINKDFHSLILRGERDITPVIRPIISVPDTVKVSAVLPLMQKNKTHIILVTDEFGGTLGIVTLEDVLEELVGEIWDEHDEEIVEITKTDENVYRVLCGADTELLSDVFGKQVETDSATINGWVMENFGRIPDVGDSFDYDDLHVTVTQKESRRVTEVTITVREGEAADGKDEKTVAVG